MTETQAQTATAVSPNPQTPPTVTVQTANNGRTALWTLVAVGVGFLLPVCACGMLLFAGLATLPFMAAEGGSSAGGFGDAVAIVRVEGEIVSGRATDFAAGSAVSGGVIADLEAASADPSVKAVVLRVDSPGGSVVGSAEIHDVVRDMQKPVVVSMGELAASGGYYVSAPASYIIARPETWTGSIGVIVQIINAEKLTNELGVEAAIITSADNKALGNLFRELTPDQEAIFQELVDESFAEFVQVIVNGRNLPRAEVLSLADGRIYSGRQALDLGLVDALGDQDDAIAKAAELGGISGTPRIVEYERLPTFQQLLLGFSSRFLQSESDRIRASLSDLATPTLEYRYAGPGIQ